jgi:hypothetical protein
MRQEEIAAQQQTRLLLLGTGVAQGKPGYKQFLQLNHDENVPQWYL